MYDISNSNSVFPNSSIYVVLEITITTIKKNYVANEQRQNKKNTKNHIVQVRLHLFKVFSKIV